MPNTKLLGKGNPIQVDPAQSELAQLDVSSCRSIRLSVGSWADSPGPVSSLLHSAGGVDRVAIRSPLRTLAALIRARWVNNWGQLPTCRPRASS
jgi:hypothetical protein